MNSQETLTAFYNLKVRFTSWVQSNLSKTVTFLSCPYLMQWVCITFPNEAAVLHVHLSYNATDI
jgi:hypothetical protein